MLGAELRTGFAPEYLFDLLLELRNFACDHVPDEFVVHSEIAMNEPVPHPSGAAPLHLRMPHAHLLRYLLRGLADDLQAVRTKARRNVSSRVNTSAVTDRLVWIR
jgi:hypothetical protein